MGVTFGVVDSDEADDPAISEGDGLLGMPAPFCTIRSA